MLSFNQCYNPTHQVPFCDLVLCNMFDGDSYSVPEPDPIIDGAETSLSENSSDAIQLLEAAFLQWFTGIFQTAATSAIVTVWPLGNHCFHVDSLFTVWNVSKVQLFCNFSDLVYLAKFSAIFLLSCFNRWVPGNTERGGDHLWTLVNTDHSPRALESNWWASAGRCIRENSSDRSRRE